MLENYYEELKQNKNVRENLSLLRNEGKNPKEKERLSQLIGDGFFLMGLLEHEEPKVRKNAALLIGDLELTQAVGSLLRAYEKETTLFVKSAYLAALGKLEVSDHLEIFQTRLRELTASEPAENEKKHVEEEIRELEKIVTGIVGIKRHKFTGFAKPHELLLATNREQRNVTMAKVTELSADIRRKAELHPLGVLVHTKEVQPFTRLRTYRELLFPVPGCGKVASEPKQAAEAVWNAGLWELLTECHKEDAPFYFRLELKSRMELDQKSRFAKRFSAELERLSARKFINSTKDYELEIRLLETKDGSYMTFFKLFTIPMKRFAYRRNAIASSIHPATAAMLMELASPYLREGAQILDPFCGVGTMLIERDIRVPAREKYGIDIFGEAIRMARENAAAAGEKINFINRDYFDFKHDYKFDEIVTNMPTRGKKTREEMDAFYADFFRKSKGILASGAVIVMYSNETGFVKKQLRLQAEYRLLQEYCIREKDCFYLFVIQFKE